MSLKPQDLIVLLKLALHRDDEASSYAALAVELGMSASEVHAAVQRAMQAGLLTRDRRPARAALLEFLVHGVRYAFAPDRGGITRGLPTAHAAPPLADDIASAELPPVWPDPKGSVRGEAFSPLFRSAVTASRRDPTLYQCLALVDALRGG